MTDDEDQPTPPPPEIAEKLRRELTAELLERVAKYARRRIRFKRRAGALSVKDVDLEAANMATDAATLTIIGRRTWEPRVPLFVHLCGVVRSESSAEVTHHRKQRHRPLRPVSMEESNDGEAKRDGKLAAYGTNRSARPRRMVTLADARDRLMAGLRVLARGDQHVNALLDAFAEGCEEAGEARVYANLTKDDYRNAKRRLDRMVEALPDNIEDDARDALEVSYGY